MQPHMVITTPLLAGNGHVRHVHVSLPLVPALIAADPGKYALPENVPPPESRDLRRIRQGKVLQPRAPSLRTLVRLAVRCQSAEELGQKLRRRYQRQALRARKAARE